MSTAEIPKRLFRFGTTTVEDPDPKLPPEEVKQLYAANYPHLATATVSDPVLENGALVFTFEAPQAKTKG